MDFEKIRSDFPILSQKIRGRDLVYLDNGATTQKPQIVIDTISNYYAEYNSNIHRGVHHLSQVATQAYEDARTTIQNFIGAAHNHEIIFTSGTTAGINLVASTWGRKNITEGDEVLISAMEHHSNIVPWQMLCEEKNAQLKVIPMNDEGELILSEFDKLLTSKTKIVAVNHISNSLGTINPIEEIISKAHSNGTVVLIDGAQAVSHMPLNMVELDADFYVFSAHKLFGPTGAGILYGKEDLMNNMPPYQGGGDMIKTVTFEKTTYNDLPHKMEAGTPNIVGGIATAAGIEYIQSIGFEAIVQKENELKEAATKMLLSIPGLKIYGEASNKISVISFMIKGLHPYDVGTILDQLGIAIRTGHHCTQPVMDFFDIPGTIRASFSFYNDQSDIDALEKGLLKAISMLN
ncbi:MAG: cysteine desulfurase/selenocysteine lyase [Parvicellaceae bacterium]|jgi:cysteine desulfurase/selenocysteine lyase